MNPRSPLARGREGWQYISLPRGPTGSAGHLENRIPARTCGNPERGERRGSREKRDSYLLRFRRATSKRTKRPVIRQASLLALIAPMDPKYAQRRSAGSRGRSISFERRVRSWLRMNAGGAPNTCKSNGTPSSEGKRVANG